MAELEGPEYGRDDPENIAEWRRMDMMYWIAGKLGYRPRKQLTKRMLNSAICYIAGEYVRKPADLNEVSHKDLRDRLATECGFAYIQTDDWHAKQDRSADYSPANPPQDRAYRRPELGALVLTIDDTIDSRPHAVEGML